MLYQQGERNEGKIEIEEHTCPFKEEIHGDEHSLCNCCFYSTYQCSLNL